MSLDDKLKNMTLSELLDKEKQLKIYLAKVEKEIANHKKSGSRGSAENTFPMQLFSSSERTKSVEKPKPKPKPKSKPKNLGELARETRNEKPAEKPAETEYSMQKNSHFFYHHDHLCYHQHHQNHH